MVGEALQAKSEGNRVTQLVPGWACDLGLACSNWLLVKVEHFALQVAEPVAMAEWYVKNLGCTVARAGGEPAHARFLMESGGSAMLEIYRNPKVSVPDYNGIDPLLMHLAFVSEDPAGDRDRLTKAGAKVVEDLTTTPAGDQLIMLRDPWGISLQLVKRAVAMLKAAS